MSDDWVRCRVCGARMKAGRLDEHLEQVHHGGAASRADRKRVRQRRERLRKARVGALALVALAGIVAGGYALTQLGERTPSTLDPDGEPAIGAADAPLTVYLFEDYQCPHCADFELSGGFEHLRSTWVAPGEVRVVFKDLAFVGQDSVTAAEASQCVWEQNPGAWLDWKHTVLSNQGPERSRWASQANLEAMTREWGRIDADAFSACLAAGTHNAEVLGDRREARENAVSGTPAMVVGDRVINPADTPLMDQAIRAALEG